jgi:hypothetical protein
MAMVAMGQRETTVAEFCREIGGTRHILYRHVAPDGSLRLLVDKRFIRKYYPLLSRSLQP